MPTTFPDRLYLDGHVYEIDAWPLEPYLVSLPARPVVAPTPFSQRGYVAAWSIVDDALYLAELSREPLARLFAHATTPVQAVWFDGVVRGWHGDRRETGYPPRTFFDNEIVLDIVAGIVQRRWDLDLHALPDQTDDELRLSLPRFLWPARLGDA